MSGPVAEFCGYDAVGLAAAIRAGELSAVEAVSAAINRIEELDPALNAIVDQRFEAALAETEAGLPDGPLTGVPVVIKALGADVAGLCTSRGSRLWADTVAAADSELVRRYRAAGMVVLGMTNTPELGKNASTEPTLHGPTHNPWRAGYSAGGSSGGTAAAVMAGMVPVGHANDGGGSIRIPAGICGAFGLKPSRGRVSPAPYASALANPTSVQHAISRTVRDSALLLDISAGPLAGDAYGAPSPAGSFASAVAERPAGLRIGLLTGLRNGPETHPDCVAAAERTARLCESLGHRVIPFEVPWDSGRVQTVSGMIMGASMVATVNERLAELGRELAEDDLEPFSRVMLDIYSGVSAGDFAAALEDANTIGWEVGGSFAEVDLLLSPVLCQPTPEFGLLDTTVPESLYQYGTAFSGWTTTFNVTGMPAMSVPAGEDGNGMPIGAQFVGPYGAERLLLSMAGQLEEAAPWPLLAPVAGAPGRS